MITVSELVTLFQEKLAKTGSLDAALTPPKWASKEE